MAFELWAVFTLLAVVTWASSNVIDKIVLTKWVKNPYLPIMIVSVVGLVFSLFVYLSQGLSALTMNQLILTLLLGLTYVVTVIFYFKAIQIEEISRIIPLYSAAPLFVLILASVFLGEFFAIDKYFGIFFLVMGGILISIKKGFKISLGKAFLFMMLSSLSWAASSVLTRYLVSSIDFWTVFVYARIGQFLAALPIFYLHAKELVNVIKQYGKKVLVGMTVSETLAVGGTLLYTIALSFSLGYASLVSALAAAQQFFVLLIATFLSLFYPKIIKEDTNNRTIWLKLIAMILLVIGVVLIT